MDKQARIEIFLRVKDRLPNKKGDGLTKEICVEFIEKFTNNKKYNYLIPLAFKLLGENK